MYLYKPHIINKVIKEQQGQITAKSHQGPIVTVVGFNSMQLYPMSFTTLLYCLPHWFKRKEGDIREGTGVRE